MVSWNWNRFYKNILLGLQKCPFVLVFIILLWGNCPSQAAELMDPIHIIEKKQFTLGLEFAYLFEIQYDDTTADATRHFNDGSTQDYQYAVTNLTLKEDQYYFLTLNYGLLDRLSLFVKAGVVTGGKKTSGSNPDRYYNMDTNFTWALGGKFKLLESENGGSLVLSAQYLRYDNRGQERAWVSAWNTNYELDQWRIDAQLVGAWQFGSFTPYAGVKYSHVNLNLSGTSAGTSGGVYRVTHSEYTSNNEIKWGMLAGLAWDITPTWRLVGQGDFIVDTTASLSLVYQFPTH
jgi:hypothetical protein